MNFDVYGPFPIRLPTQNYERWRSEFWRHDRYSEDRIRGLKRAIGCYAFCLTNGKATKPWYVGKTRAVEGFAGEIFQDHKIKHYKNVRSRHRGRATMLLFPLIRGPSDGEFSYAHSSADRAISWLERTLIGMALARNPDIVNERDTMMLRNVWVNGLIGERFAGRPYSETLFARSAFLKG